MRIERWGAKDFNLLVRLLGDPAMTVHIGGPESQTKLLERQGRYEKRGSRQFKIVDANDEPVGWVGYWERDWRDQPVYEIGWSVLPEHQGRGLAAAATALLLAEARSEKNRRFVHAFPSVANGPSNAICRKLGFTLLGACDFEYPPGNPMTCNDWRFDLRGE